MTKMTKKTKVIKTAGLEYENKFYEQGYHLIAGIDEVGRGPLAGPVVACAVIIPQGLQLPGVYDSKVVSEKNRIALAENIKNVAVSWSLGWVDQDLIDEINILQATYAAMSKAVEGLNTQPQALLIDGIAGKLQTAIPCDFVKKGDSLSHSIAAASILAKVARDAYMLECHEQYPEYGFDTHKGYGTKKHIEALRKYGACPLHRRTFLKGMIN